MKALRMDQLRPEAPLGYSATFVLNSMRELEFWEDAKTFLKLLDRRYLDVLKVWTYRRLSFYVQEFVRAKTSKERQTVIAEIKKDIAAAPSMPPAAPGSNSGGAGPSPSSGK
jgi:hypothetical protein